VIGTGSIAVERAGAMVDPSLCSDRIGTANHWCFLSRHSDDVYPAQLRRVFYGSVEEPLRLVVHFSRLETRSLPSQG
jgi:hypothetical protein